MNPGVSRNMEGSQGWRCSDRDINHFSKMKKNNEKARMTGGLVITNITFI